MRAVDGPGTAPVRSRSRATASVSRHRICRSCRAPSTSWTPAAHGLRRRSLADAPMSADGGWRTRARSRVVSSSRPTSLTPRTRLHATSRRVPAGAPALQSDKDLIGNGLRDVDSAQMTAASRHIRPTVAKWLRDISLGTRLSLFVALIVVGVVTSVAYLEVRSFEQHIDRDLVDAARLGAQSAADALAQRAPPLDPLDIRDTLHDLVEADPVIDAISVIEADEAGDVRVFTSTSTEERAEVAGPRRTSHRDQGARQRSQQHRGDVRVAGAASRELRRGRHRRPGEPAPGARARPARRARIRGPHHRARDRSSSTSPSAGCSASRSAPSCGPWTRRQAGDLRARTTIDAARRARHDRRGTQRDARSAGAIQPVAARARSRRPPAICRSATRSWPPARASCSRCGNRWRAPSGWRRWARSPPTSPTRRARR